MVYGIVTVYILTKTNCSLLPVKQFIIAVVTLYPIHNIERKVLLNRANDFIALLVFVDKFTLKGRTNIQASAVANNAIFRAVYVTLDNFPYRDFV